MTATSRVPRRRRPLLWAGVSTLLLVAAVAWLQTPVRAPAPDTIWVTPPVPATIAPGAAVPITVALTPGDPPPDWLPVVGLLHEQKGRPVSPPRPVVMLYPPLGVLRTAQALATREVSDDWLPVGDYERTAETRVVGGATWERWTRTRD